MDMGSINSFMKNVQLQNAQSVTQANLGSLKTQKEITQDAVKEEHTHEPSDAVSLSAAAEPTQDQELLSAENSGDLSQIDPQLKNRDQDRVESGRQHALHMAEEELQQGSKEVGEAADPLKVDVESADGMRRPSDQELIEQLLGDIPGDIQKVSGEMVTNQIKGTQPANSLARLHNIPEPAQKELKGEPFLAETLPIHDSSNQPMPLHLEEAGV